MIYWRFVKFSKNRWVKEGKRVRERKCASVWVRMERQAISFTWKKKGEEEEEENVMHCENVSYFFFFYIYIRVRKWKKKKEKEWKNCSCVIKFFFFFFVYWYLGEVTFIISPDGWKDVKRIIIILLFHAQYCYIYSINECSTLNMAN